MDQYSYVTGVFGDRERAERAFESARTRGYTADDLDVVMTEETRNRFFAAGHEGETDLGSKAKQGAEVGGAVGGTLGAIAGLIAAVGGSFVVPGIGLVVAGPLAAGLAGAGAGAATGGLVGALIGRGMPQDQVARYQDSVNQGGILLGLRPRTPEDAAYFEQDWSDPATRDPMLQKFGI